MSLEDAVVHLSEAWLEILYKEPIGLVGEPHLAAFECLEDALELAFVVVYSTEAAYEGENTVRSNGCHLLGDQQYLRRAVIERRRVVLPIHIVVHKHAGPIGIEVNSRSSLGITLLTQMALKKNWLFREIGGGKERTIRKASAVCAGEGEEELQGGTVSLGMG